MKFRKTAKGQIVFAILANSDGTLPLDEVCYSPGRIPGSLTTD
jgi:hypothetical protein